jgi:hypothetical protein
MLARAPLLILARGRPAPLLAVVGVLLGAGLAICGRRPLRG